MFYFWYQMPDGKVWHLSDAAQRETVLRNKTPEFVTVLDASSTFDESDENFNKASVKYRGPMYFDWDNENDLASAIEGFKSFLGKLAVNGVNLHSLGLYASGSKGFHLEIPMGIFMDKPPKAGIQGLPYIYREVALSNVTEDLDLRVYSASKGRMWRCLGHVRPNGKYKVPLKVEDALTMTVEKYVELTSERPEKDFDRDPPELNVWLATEFSVASDKVARLVKARSKIKESSEDLVKHFRGEYPQTVKDIMQGHGLAENAGFQKIALQLAITANALKKEKKDFLADCEGLCQTYQGDSSRYGSPRKRREELARMFEYTFDNSQYSYSAGAIKSLLDPSVSTIDLEGPRKALGIGQLDESCGDAHLTPEQKAQMSAADEALMDGLSIDEGGVKRSTGDSVKSISNIGYKGVILLLEAMSEQSEFHNVHLGIEAEIYADGDVKGRHVIPDKAFASRAAFGSYMSAFGGVITGTDAHANLIKLILTRAANAGGKVVFAVHKEGLDLIQDPRIKDRISKDAIWVHKEIVIKLQPKGEGLDTHYVYQPAMGTAPIFNSDVHRANQLPVNDDTKEWLKAVMEMNEPINIAKMLGWTVSCFHKQFYQAAFGQFPLLHPNGPAGSGKSMTSTFFCRMFHMKTEPAVRSCGSVTTQFALKTYLTGSASVPAILEEYKPIEMGQVRTDFILQSLRLAYNQAKGSSGAMNNSSASSSFRDIADYSFSTPIVLIAETQETQTAIMQRSIAVSFKEHEAIKRTLSYNRATANQERMSQLGRLILAKTAGETVESRRAALAPLIDKLRGHFPRNVHDRQIYNLAVVLAGLNFLEDVLQDFGPDVLACLATLKQSIFEHKAESIQVVLSEASKMLNDLSLISRTEIDDSEYALREGYEYLVMDGYMEILMRETFVKYNAWCKRKGVQPFYTTSEGFCKAMEKYSATMDKECELSKLKSSGQAKVFRFNLARLTAEGVEAFKTRA